MKRNRHWFKHTVFGLIVSVAAAFGETGTPGPEASRTILRRLYEACRIRQQQMGRFPASLTEIGALLSDDLRHRIPPGVQFDDPESPKNLLRRRSPIGERAPCLRLEYARNRWLNVACSGWIYESGLYWESQFVHLLPRPYSNPVALAQDWRPVSSRFPARSSACDSNQVNLSLYGNALPTEPWFTGQKLEGQNGGEVAGGEQFPPNFGDWIRTGVLQRGALLFDVRCVLQLDGELSPEGAGPRWIRSYPREISGVVVGRGARRIHLLAGTVGQATPGAVVAVLRLHFSSGQTVDWPLRYGEQVAAPEDAATGSDRLYPVTDEQKAFTAASEIRYSLHHVWLANPQLDQAVESIDFRSGLVTSHPFVLAMTLEP